MTPTIYEWGGGREAFERWLNVFYDLVEEEPELAALFGGRVSEEHRDHVTAWWCEVMGGPDDYTAEHGGYEHMLAKHRGAGDHAEQRLRFVTLLSRAADDAGLPDDPEFRAALMGYAEWGRGSRSTTPSRARRSPSTRRCHVGAGASRRRTPASSLKGDSAV